MFFWPQFAVQAIEYGGFGGRPANPRIDNPRTQSIFIHTVTPGTVVDDGVLVVNNSGEEKTVLVYAADSTPSTGGAFACKQFSEPKIGVGAWIELAKSEITLAPGSNEVIPFTISTPVSAGVGEHNGCILIQEKKERSSEEVGALLSVRTGLRVAITVPGDIVRRLEIVGFSLSPQPEKQIIFLHPLVKNTGNVSIDANVRVITKYFFGLVHAEHGGQYPILRGETSDWNFELKKPFWGGWYQSSFIIEYDESSLAVVGVNSGKELTTIDGPTYWFFSMPTPLAFILEVSILLIVIIGLFLLRLSYRQKKWIKGAWVAYNIEPGDDINHVAEKFHVAWKLLVSVNKLKPPYTLKPGDTIRVPPLD